jgi:hypothetical protein
MKRTTDIKIKKVEVRNEKVCPILTEIEISKIEQNKNSFQKINFGSVLNFFKQKLAYISFAFMSVSVAMYIFFITSIIVFAVQERSFIFSASQIEINQNLHIAENIEFENKIESTEKEAKVENTENTESIEKLAVLSNNVIYIKRVEDVNSGLSVR